MAIDLDLIRACTTVDRHPFHLPNGVLVPVQEAISLNGKLWRPGETITIGFLDGSSLQRLKAEKWIDYWMQVVHLDLRFVSAAAGADVRITFAPGGSWSLIGTDCRRVPSGPTMQLGWVTDASTDEADRAVIVHETGHMLGLGHEQSSPWNTIHWNVPVAEAYYERTQHWSPQMVQDNVFSVFGPGEVTGTAYDPSSIMQYPVPAELTLDGRGIPWNTNLSTLDRTYAMTLYPPVLSPVPPVPVPVPPPPPSPVLPQLRIGAPYLARPFAGSEQPADYALDVPAAGNLTLDVVVSGGFGRDPVVVLETPGHQHLTLGLVRGSGVFRFAAGAYVVRVHHPLPALAGTAWVRVTAA